ncbi:MAG: succinate dehydrogenase cytochrome b subunit [bacterium]
MANLKIPVISESHEQYQYKTSSIGRKILMAITGMCLIGFVTGHLLGNLQIFMGQNQINLYAQTLKDLSAFTYVVRAILLVIGVLHIYSGLLLYFHNKASRPVDYKFNNTIQASLASRTMVWSGLGIFFFVIYHLLHFTFIVTNPQYADLHDNLGRHDVYSMIVLGFQNYLISGVYIIAIFFLAYHLSHAVSSLFQSMGWNKNELEHKLKLIAYLYAILVFIGYVSIPVAIMTGCITLPGGAH